MNEKVTRFPITYSERRKNMVGPLCVECQVCHGTHKTKLGYLERGGFICN